MAARRPRARAAAGTTMSAASLVTLAAAVVFVALLAVFVLRQGRGRTSTVVALPGDDGMAEIDTAVPAALLEEIKTAIGATAAHSISLEG